MTEEKLSVIRLVSYCELFDYPLKEEELLTYPISGSSPDLDEAKLASGLAELVAEGFLYKDQGSRFHCFPDKIYTIEKRLERQVSSSRLMNKAVFVSQVLASFPWVGFISVTGALAFSNSHSTDDIDLMVVTARNRLWLTRALIFFLLRSLNLKKGQKSILGGNAFCVNVWMDEADLSIENEDQDLVIAFDLVGMKVLVDKNHFLEKIFIANPWVVNFLPRSIARSFGPIGDKTQAVKRGAIDFLVVRVVRRIFNLPVLIATWFLDWLEDRLRRLQMWLIKRRFPDNPHIRMSSSRLWQHPTNRRGQISLRYKTSLQSRIASLS